MAASALITRWPEMSSTGPANAIPTLAVRVTLPASTRNGLRKCRMYPVRQGLTVAGVAEVLADKDEPVADLGEEVIWTQGTC
jgi:hypothetical protein